ncbi:hypothetical protein ECHWAK_0345 [Ehrlichia chaffeensis str. Wakulla]|nr:hypothetical protein ECHWAK_0345 [Ehrlichia chaffeensis str. Wakulla]
MLLRYNLESFMFLINVSFDVFIVEFVLMTTGMFVRLFVILVKKI